MRIRLLTLALLMVLPTALSLSAKERIKGNGNIATRTIPIDGFNELRLGSGIGYNYKVSGINVFKSKKKNSPKFFYTQSSGGGSELVITMDENLFAYLDIEQSGGKLRIRAKEEDMELIATSMVMKAKSEGLVSVDVYGAIDFIAESSFTAGNLRLSVSGVGDMIFRNLSCNSIVCDISGVGSAYLTGTARKGDYHVSGVGKIFAFDCVAEDLACEVSGVGKIEACATKKLNADTSGIGSIRYRGVPETLNANSSGIGSVKQE